MLQIESPGIGNHGVAEAAGFQRCKGIFFAPHPVDFIEILGTDGRIRFTLDVSLGIHEIKDIVVGEYQTAMLDFAEKTDGNEADRTAEGFAKMFGSYFPPEFSITEGNAWMSTLNNSVQYVSVIRPGEKVAKLVKRMHYVSFVGMFRSDLFEGLCVGHAPKKCKICGKWFLTTNARHTKYCGGYAPGDKLHRTCWQIGNLKGREQRELADDHPLKQIYEKRLNTINRYIKRGTLDEDLAEVMKKLAKDKMLQALSNVAYAKGDYEKEMGQAALKKEALKRI